MRRTLLSLTVFALLAIAPSAQAASTIGQVFTPTAQTTATVAQTGISSGVGYTVTKDGVITSWSFQGDSDGATVRLKAARLNPDGSYSIVGESDYQTVDSNQLQSFQTRIPVKAGDVIGTAGQSGKTVAYTGANDDQVVLSPGDQPAGSSGNYSNVQGIRVDVSASVEADVDGDGFGDDSQDLCTNDPGTQTACSGDLQLSARAERGMINPGNEVAFLLTLTNRGPSRAVGVRLRAELSDELVLVGSEGADCSGSPVVCKLADLDNDGQATVKLVARSVRVGQGSVAATASATTADARLGNNAAGANVAIVWKPGRCANVFQVGAGNAVKRGTGAGDLIDGLLGNDSLDGLDGADCLTGGAGNDRLTGDDGNDQLDGGPGNDILSGGSGNDKVDGGSGNDKIAGGSGVDRLNGDSGNDTINAADGKRDRVDCGSGRGDRVTADRGDLLEHCERVAYVKKKRKR
jgi:Ca2+-binding RTX toxin-like protein